MEKTKIETTNMDLKIKIPTKYYIFLQKLGQFVNSTPEEILTTEVYGTLRCFFSGGFLEGWIENAFEEEDGKALEKLVREVSNIDE